MHDLRVAVVPYGPAWPRRFEAERAVLERVLARWLVGGIHHVGSTSVPGLAAKPIIDMIAGVQDLEEARKAFDVLRGIDYHYSEHRREAHSFHKPICGYWWEETHHLHLTEPGSDLWRERLAFRDALRADPGLAKEYAEWKRRHAVPGREPNSYTADKRPFVARVLAAGGIDLKPDLERLTSAAYDLRARRSM